MRRAPSSWTPTSTPACAASSRRAGTFDAIVLDPPKFAPTVAHAERAARAYKDINRLALKLLAPGGVLFTFSCSGGISADLFHKIVASAGIDAGVDGYITERLGAAPDHPMTSSFPKGEYLKGLVVVRTMNLPRPAVFASSATLPPLPNGPVPAMASFPPPSSPASSAPARPRCSSAC